MTEPQSDQTKAEEIDGAAGNTGALSAASKEDPEAGDPLGPLNAVTEGLAEDDDKG